MKSISYLLLFLLLVEPPAQLHAQISEYEPITADNVERIQQIALLTHDSENTISQLTFHPSDRTLFSLAGVISLWDIETGSMLKELLLPTDYATSFSIHPNGNYLLYGGWDLTDHANFATLNHWNLNTDENTLLFREGNDDIEVITFNQDGKLYAAAGWDEKHTRVWKAKTDEMLVTLPGYAVRNLEFTQSNPLIVSGGETVVWDTERNMPVLSLDSPYVFQHPGLNAVFVRPNSSNQPYSMIDLERPDIAVPVGIDGSPFTFNTSGDLITIVYDGEIWLADFESGERLVAIGYYGGNFPPPIAFAPDGKYIAVPVGPGEIGIWGVPAL